MKLGLWIALVIAVFSGHRSNKAMARVTTLNSFNVAEGTDAEGGQKTIGCRDTLWIRTLIGQWMTLRSLTIAVLNECEINLSQEDSTNIDQHIHYPLDNVTIVSEPTAEAFPLFPVMARSIQLRHYDPVGYRLSTFWQVRNELAQQFRAFAASLPAVP